MLKVTERYPRFSVDWHSIITSEANAGYLDEQQLSIVILNNMLQDVHQTQSQFHFDNCAFNEGLNYIISEWRLIENDVYDISDPVLSAFGRLLHTVQDFYSHSNWIELHVNYDPVPLWDLSIESLPKQILSGVWALGNPKRCLTCTPTHTQLNKDKPDTEEGSKIITVGPNQGKTLFELARNSAMRASKEQFKRLSKSEAIRKPLILLSDKMIYKGGNEELARLLIVAEAGDTHIR